MLKDYKPNELEIVPQNILGVCRTLLLPGVEQWKDGYIREELEEEVPSIWSLGGGAAVMVGSGRALKEGERF